MTLNLPCMPQFEVGEKVLILDDLEKVKRLQDGHGGFASHMKKVGDVIPCSCTTFAVNVRTVNNVKLHTFRAVKLNACKVIS